MQIQHIQNNYCSPKFGYWQREVFKTTTTPVLQELKHRNDTRFYRDGGRWYRIVNMLTEKYKKTPKVNTYCYGCSNGSEPYTFLMELMSVCDKAIVQKFLPIIAKDYDEVAINMAKSNKLPIGASEQNVIKQYTGSSIDKYFDKASCSEDLEDYYSAKPILTNNVQFGVADILEDYKNIEPNNTIVFARNFWPYLSDENQKELATNLGHHLGKNSTLIIGDYDLINHKSNNYIPALLWDAGFNPTDKDTIFVKP